MIITDSYQDQLLDDLQNGRPLRPPRTFQHHGITIIDDRSKLRAAARIMQGSLADHFFVAGSPYGATIDAAARVAKSLGRKLTIVFTQTAEDTFEILQRQMGELGAKTINCPYEEFNTVSGIAQQWAEEKNAQYINFTDDVVVGAMADGLSQLNIRSGDIWAAGGLGTLCRAIRQGMGNDMRLMVVDVADQPAARFEGAHLIIKHPAPLNQRSTADVPFPCNDCFERKAWPIMLDYYQKHPLPKGGVYFMNTAFK